MSGTLWQVKNTVNGILSPLDLEIRRRSVSAYSQYPVEATAAERNLLDLAGRYSMTGPIRMWAVIQSIRHVVRNSIPGDFVECGVWRGGNLILMRRLADELCPDRTVFGFDTFDGMSPATEVDVDYTGRSAADEMRKSPKREGKANIHAYATIDTVRANLEHCSASQNVVLVQGKVEDTLLQQQFLPESISVLRLDTDWYESTKMELQILYPRLSVGGVLIVDDYGYFKGAQKAVDEYFADRDVWLHYVDYTCRLLIKA